MSGRRTSSAAQTPARLAKSESGSTGKGQRSILGFFSKASPAGNSDSSLKALDSSPCLKEITQSNSSTANQRRTIEIHTPVPSSDAIEPTSSQENRDSTIFKPVAADAKMGTRPLRKAKKTISHAESSDEEDSDIFVTPKNRCRQRGSRPRPNLEESEDDFQVKSDSAAEEQDGDLDDFIASDESDVPSKKRKRSAPKSTKARKRSTAAFPAAAAEEEEQNDEITMGGSYEAATAEQWRYDPDNDQPGACKEGTQRSRTKTGPQSKRKVKTEEPETRREWLANIKDANQNPPDHPDYDPRTLYIPPNVLSDPKALSPFEKQYWEIKKDLWDTVVFFKKGKFYELYEKDATIGHQLFDLKMTDRVNMRMVGVPESSLDIWVNQFVAKGYKVARVDQMESALGKEMRERGGAPKSKGKEVIRRELSCILTGGTLVEGSMLQDDMATYCAAIKESVVEDQPSFGIAFVDAATGQFFVSEFEDDAEFTKFETFVAQTSPRELLLEKSHISSKALRILKNNTTPTTIWNHLKAGTEFWEPSMARRELDYGGYFGGSEGEDGPWPEKLQHFKDKDLAMSAFGALTYYLRVLQLDRSLLSQGNVEAYNPIHRNGTLILEGQTLINLEIFSNTANGGPEGTLFNLLNRCVTPFGKRLFRQWVCHPLCNIHKINERLDAVDQLNADRSLRDQFTSSMTKMPDLERLISRIHAGSCRPETFVKVLEGFEQIEYTVSLLEGSECGSGLISRLMASMPNLKKPLAFWKTAFDRTKARNEKLLMPHKGVDEDFDNSEAELSRIKAELERLLARTKSSLNCKSLKFTDLGKEIYQVEAPKSLKVPSTWRQMSATSSLKRYYFKELEDLTRELLEAEETHSQIVKNLGARFCERFDNDYAVWLQAIRVMSQLDCLIGLAKISSALGEPSCRPEFVNHERSVLEFKELRHPCMSNLVDDFIPNDIKLGGDEAKINLLTGANAAGKSTVLRMSCTAVIMAQIGCYVPAASARLSPVDRIMSRLGAQDNIFAAQSTFFVELSETKKILSEATPRSLVILDELGRGTSSYDGVAVAQAVLHHVASHIGCIGFFATHYHSLATEFENHPEVRARRMQIHVDDEDRRITFLYKLEDGVAEGSFGMHCAAMCGIANKIIERAEMAAREFEHTSRLKESLELAKQGCYIPLGLLSDVASLLRDEKTDVGRPVVDANGLEVLIRAIDSL